MSARRASETQGNVVHWSPVQSGRRLHTELCTTHTTVEAVHQGPSGISCCIRGFRTELCAIAYKACIISMLHGE